MATCIHRRHEPPSLNALPLINPFKSTISNMTIQPHEIEETDTPPIHRHPDLTHPRAAAPSLTLTIPRTLPTTVTSRPYLPARLTLTPTSQVRSWHVSFDESEGKIYA